MFAISVENSPALQIILVSYIVCIIRFYDSKIDWQMYGYTSRDGGDYDMLVGTLGMSFSPESVVQATASTRE